MELQKFISESIKQICFGIREAQKEVSDEIGNFPIAPAYVGGKLVIAKREDIEFDIAITVTEDNKLNASGGINIKVLDGSIKKDKSEKTENIHRINFKVPFYPQALFKNNVTKNE